MFPIQLVEYLNQNKINTICWVVSALTMISAFGTFDTIKPQYLKTVTFCGEVFPVKQFNIWKNALPDVEFFNLYGPTEATGVCTYYHADHLFEEGEAIPIGKTFKNTEILLLNKEGCGFMKKASRIILAVTLTLALVSGSVSVTESEAASVPKLKDKKITVVQGETKTIKVKGQWIKSKKFQTTKKSIATVTKKGKVKGKKVGSCIIKVTVKYKKTKKAKRLSTRKLTCKVKVVKKQNVSPKPTRQPDLNITAAFTGQVADTSVKLMKQSALEDIKGGKNVLISPESILTAMAMVVNGAGGDTLTEMQKALYGSLSVEEFNKNMSAYNDYLVLSDSVKFHLANGIWIRNQAVEVDPGFLATNETYYHSKAYLEPFDNTTVKKMNDWVKIHTNGMIPSIIHNIPATASLYLMNALAFEGRWAIQYKDHQVKREAFTTASGEKKTVNMLNSTEHTYLKDDKATGVMKSYEGYDYAFVAILPNKGISLEQYLAGMTGESFVNMIRSGEQKEVLTKIPEFSYDYDTNLISALQSMGIEKAFTSEADFSRMAKTKDGTWSIASIVHKTHMELDKNGTKAAAVTAILKATSAAPTEPPNEVYLDRPFLYAIVEESTGLPIFMGAVNTVK